MLYKLHDKKVSLTGTGHFIAPNATIIGDVELGDSVSIWFNVVIRADNDSIKVGACSNIQDGTVLHVDSGVPLDVGEGVTIGHKAMLHGCTVGNYSLIGINAVVLNRARIGNYCLIGANTLVPEGMEIPDGSLVVGSPAKIKRQLTDPERKMLELSAHHYVTNGQRYNAQLEEINIGCDS